MNDAPNDEERYPTLTEAGQRMLRFLREHPNAPLYRNQSGNRLSADDIGRVRAFEQEMAAAPVEFHATAPSWTGDFIRDCYELVPHYRTQGSPPAQLTEVPSISRAELARDIAAFVPTSVELSRLINFRTTGTTGHPLLIASHPRVAAGYLAFHKRAFRRVGIELRHRRDQVGVLLLGFQKKCFTYVSVTPTMDESGLAKINLHPDDWRHPDDRARYIDALSPEVIAGDPISFVELLNLDLHIHPRVLLSTSMSLAPGLRQRLATRFACPVLDVYSLNEAGPIAVYDDDLHGHVLLQPHLYVEILGPDDVPVAPGQRGEITLTGGFNFCLPLLRYRTGDFASLEQRAGEPVLVGLQGRAPVVFRTQKGELLNNIDVTHALGDLAIGQYSLHQQQSGALTLLLRGYHGTESDVRQRLLNLFGQEQPLDIQTTNKGADKTVQYSSELTLSDAFP